MHKSNSGNALLLALLTITILSSFAGIALQYTSSQARFGRRSQEMNTAYAVADGTLEIVFSRLRTVLRSDTSHNFNVATLTGSSNYYGSDITNVSLQDVGIPNTESLRIDKVQLTHVDVFGRPQPSNADIDANIISQASNPLPVAGVPYYRGPVPGSSSFTGFNIIYEAKVWVTSTVNASSGAPTTVGVKRYFTKAICPTMQAAIFYNDQLELHPGSDMQVNGLVHTNSSLYAGGYNKGSLQSHLFFNQETTYVGSSAKMTDVDLRMQNMTIDQVRDPEVNAPTRSDRMSIGGVDPDEFKLSDYDSNGDAITTHNADSYREIIERPIRKSTAAGMDPATTPYNTYYDNDRPTIRSQRAYNQAALKILLKYKKNSSGNYVLDMDLNTGTQVRGKTVGDNADGPNLRLLPGVDTLLATFLNTTDATTPGARTAVYDPRENTDVQVTTVDIGKLKTVLAANMGELSPNHFDGVLYISDVTGAAADGSYGDKRDVNFGYYTDTERENPGNLANGGTLVKHAIMLTNGAQLPDASKTIANPDAFFTVATDNPVYIKGDYNTGAKGTLVDSNSLNPGTQPSTYASGYTPVTSAILSDTVTSVSDRFKPQSARSDMWDTGSDGDTLVRGAANTTINTAIVSGYSPTVDTGDDNSTSSGGAHNLIRLMENWSQSFSQAGTKQNLTYNGSLMESYTSKQFNGSWSNSGHYQNPNRVVSFDSNFITKPPKGTPVTIVYARGRWERFSAPIPP